MNKAIKATLNSLGVVSVVGTILGIGGLAIQKENEEVRKRIAESDRRIEAVVLSEKYENTLSSVPEKTIEGFVSRAYSNETVALDSKYTLKIRTVPDGKIMGLSIIDAVGNNSGNVRKEAIDTLISEGSRISFPRGNLYNSGAVIEKSLKEYKDETYIGEDTQVATKRADRVRIESPLE